MTEYVNKDSNFSQDLLQELRAYSESGMYPFHMPGHKRRYDLKFLSDFPNPFSIDTTEVDGLDDLHHPEGILKESMANAARVYSSDRTLYLVNGSSAGIMAAISGTVSTGGALLMARNCHKSAYHGVLLRNLESVYLYPDVVSEFGIQGGISPYDVEAALKANPDIQAVMIVSPTYDGVLSDIKSIAEVAHRYNIPLIVDEAHGAHLSFAQSLNRFPASAQQLGADIVVQSVHKTLPSLTQTAVIHINTGYVDVEKIIYFTNLYQSTSPSYVLLASIDRCISYMAGKSAEMMTLFDQRIHALRKELSSLRHLKLVDTSLKSNYHVYDIDPSKIVISTRGTTMSGVELDRVLRDVHKIEIEMFGADYVTAITSLCDTEEGFSRLIRALKEVDRKLTAGVATVLPTLTTRTGLQHMKIAEAVEARTEKVRISDSIGRVAAEFVYIYPPGIPIVAPGEVLTADVVALIAQYKKLHLPIRGMQDKNTETILIVRSE